MTTFTGGNGSQTINGNAGSGSNDVIDYRGVTTGGMQITFSSQTLYAGYVWKSDGNGALIGVDNFTGIRGVIGTNAGDEITGTDNPGAGAQFVTLLQGAGGNDLIDGRNNYENQISYQYAPSGIVATFGTSVDAQGLVYSTVSDGYGSTDTLINAVRIRGSSYNDKFTGGDAAERFVASLGSDTYDGGAKSNILSYDSSEFTSGTRGIKVVAGDPTNGLFGGGTATITKFLVSTGQVVGTDTAININQFRGTDVADTFIGTSASYSEYAYRFRGGAGDDTFDGKGLQVNRVEYAGAPKAVSVDLATGKAQDGEGGTDTLINVTTVQGSSFNDTLLGAATGDHFIVTDLGSHAINGRAGVDRVSFGGTGAVTIDLGTTATNDGFGGYSGTITKSAGTDTLSNIESAQGGSGNDTLLGTPGDNRLGGGPGDNTIDGRGGYDTLTYQFYALIDTPTHGATVNLADGINGTAANPWGGTDTLLGIEAVTGSSRSDDLTGAVLASGAFSYVRGEGGNDTIRAPTAGTKIVADYSDALSGVIVDLGAGRADDDGFFGGTDTLVNINAVRGSAFGDSIVGTSGNDTMLGLAGDDKLNGGAGADWMIGGIGNDTYTVDNAGDVVIENVGEGADTVLSSVSFSLYGQYVENLTLTGTAPIDGTGNSLDNIIKGNDGANVLDGGIYAPTGASGNDTLDGGGGADRMVGRGGNDTYYVDDANDQVIEAANEGTDLVISTAPTFSLAGQQIENLTLAGNAAINGTGNSLDNVIKGNDAANVLDGGAYGPTGASGNDTLDGGGGADTMIGHGGNDTYYVDVSGDVVIEAANEGTDLVISTAPSFSLAGQYIENLTLAGSAAINGTGNSLDNVIKGNDAANVLDGGVWAPTGASGNDTLDGGGGADTMIGHGGDDTYYVDVNEDVVIEAANEGTDLVISTAPSFSLAGQQIENLTLAGNAAINGTGNSLDNVIKGNDAANVLDGGAYGPTGISGNDTLDGGLGADTLTGRQGNDTFVFSTALGAGNVDTITDFNVADDTIQLSAAIFGLPAGPLSVDAFRDIALAPPDADDRILYDSQTGKLYLDPDGSGAASAVQFATLAGIAGTLSAADFLVV